LLRPLPYHDPAGLMVLNETTPKVGTVSVSYPNFLDWRAQSHAFSKLAAVESVAFNLAGVDPATGENISGEAVSSDFLSMLGVHPLLGRNFDASQDQAGTASVVLLSYQLWQSHFGGAPERPGPLGSTGWPQLSRSSACCRPTFAGSRRPTSWSPSAFGPMAPKFNERRRSRYMVVLGRLAPGVSFAQARAEMEGIAARLAKAYPAANDQFSVQVQADSRRVRQRHASALLILFGASGDFVLLIACANVANLFLMRGAGRTKEIALRIALGASREPHRPPDPGREFRAGISGRPHWDWGSQSREFGGWRG
jgi:hypothetical protein